MLAARIQQHVDTVAAAITPKGSRPPFTRRLSAREAFDWWLKHRYDRIGLAEYAKLPAVQQQQLDAWLAQAMNPQIAPPKEQPVNVGPMVLRQAMGQERRVEGPPIGDQVA